MRDVPIAGLLVLLTGLSACGFDVGPARGRRGKLVYGWDRGAFTSLVGGATAPLARGGVGFIIVGWADEDEEDRALSASSGAETTFGVSVAPDGRVRVAGLEVGEGDVWIDDPSGPERIDELPVRVLDVTRLERSQPEPTAEPMALLVGSRFLVEHTLFSLEDEELIGAGALTYELPDHVARAAGGGGLEDVLLDRLGRAFVGTPTRPRVELEVVSEGTGEVTATAATGVVDSTLIVSVTVEQVDRLEAEVTVHPPLFDRASVEYRAYTGERRVLPMPRVECETLSGDGVVRTSQDSGALPDASLVSVERRESALVEIQCEALGHTASASVVFP